MIRAERFHSASSESRSHPIGSLTMSTIFGHPSLKLAAASLSFPLCRLDAVRRLPTNLQFYRHSPRPLPFASFPCRTRSVKQSPLFISTRRELFPKPFYVPVSSETSILSGVLASGTPVPSDLSGTEVSGLITPSYFFDDRFWTRRLVFRSHTPPPGTSFSFAGWFCLSLSRTALFLRRPSEIAFFHLFALSAPDCPKYFALSPLPSLSFID